jgi:hypothetical protein
MQGVHHFMRKNVLFITEIGFKNKIDFEEILFRFLNKKPIYSIE